MFERIIRFAIDQRWLVMLAVLGMIGIGVFSYQKLPIDAVPDITNVQVQINTEAPGYSPLEAEQRVTFPIETAMAGPAEARANALDLALRLVAGDRDLQGGHGHLFRPSIGRRANPGGARKAAERTGRPPWAQSPPVSARSTCGRWKPNPARASPGR